MHTTTYLIGTLTATALSIGLAAPAYSDSYNPANGDWTFVSSHRNRAACISAAAAYLKNGKVSGVQCEPRAGTFGRLTATRPVSARCAMCGPRCDRRWQRPRTIYSGMSPGRVDCVYPGIRSVSRSGMCNVGRPRPGESRPVWPCSRNCPSW